MKRRISLIAAVTALAIAASACSKVDDISSETVPEIDSFTESGTEYSPGLPETTLGNIPSESYVYDDIYTAPDSGEYLSDETENGESTVLTDETDGSENTGEDGNNDMPPIDEETGEWLWTETNRSGSMSVRQDCFALEQALPDSTPVQRYSAGSTVGIAALTNTGYYKLITGDYIRAEYLIDVPSVLTTAATSEAETESTFETVPEISGTAVSRTETTAASTTKRKRETTVTESETETESEATSVTSSETSRRTSASTTETTSESTSEPAASSSTLSSSETAPAVITVEEGTLFKKDYTTRYAYKQLNENERTLYGNIVKAVKNLNHEIAAPEGMSYNDIIKVYMIVFNQEAEFFWMDGSVAVANGRMTLSYKTEDPAEIARMQGEIEAKASTVLAAVNAAPSSFDKLKIMYDFAVLNNDFSTSASGFNVSIYNSFTDNGDLQCIGYAKTIQYLCDLSGFDCTVVIGTNSDNESHAWNVVYCDDGYYNLDSTWGDPINNFGADYIRYTYFLVPDSWTHNKSHFNVNKFRRNNGEWIYCFNPPSCTSEKNNYFAHTGKLYSDFDSADAAMLNAFDEAVAGGSPIAEIRVTDPAVFDKLTAKAAAYQKYVKGLSSRVSGIAKHSADVYRNNGIVFFDIIYS